ncbi:MAG: hypothetical protein MJ183_09160 [Treponemataceae bacterium]|nr:hypothetical protein [Treponemataceae bacterium]
MDRTRVIFGNPIDRRTIRKAYKTQQKYLKKFGDDRIPGYHLAAVDNEVLTPLLGIKVLKLSKLPMETLPPKSIVIGNIRMGFGHYRISMAMASCARHLGYTPLWLDLNSFPETTCTKIISSQNDLYSLGSRLSQKSRLFNKFYWEPLNSEGFRKLTYNAVDQAASELMTSLFRDIPVDTPYIATHAWPSQAAVHAGLTHSVNAIPDNWPMALHLSEGALHTVQTPSAYWGYRNLRGFKENELLKPMGSDDIAYTGHYIDHELVANIEEDCRKRIARAKNGRPIRFLLTIGGAGAQADFFASIIRTILPYVKQGKAALYINVGDYRNVWDSFCKMVPELSELCLKGKCRTHFDDWKRTLAFAKSEIDAGENSEAKIDVFCHEDIFAAVYCTNILMRACDVLVTKPSELAFYPVPKLLIRRVGGHEMWGAIRSQEVGDGTPECVSVKEACAMAENFINHKDYLIQMCNNIISAKSAGIYDGAYKVVELATK